MITRQEATAPPDLKRSDFIYLTDGPRQGDTLQAPGHSGKVCISPAPNGVPRLGSELVYEPVKGLYTSEGARCYRLCIAGRLDEAHA